MVRCVVPNCNNSSVKRSKSKDGITFHRFPRDKTRKQLWEIAINRQQGWCATSFSVVCSEHFQTHDFYLTSSGLRRLSLHAIPSVNISVPQYVEPTMIIIEHAGIAPTDSEEVVQLKNEVHRLEEIAETQRKKLDLLTQGKRRLKKKLAEMQQLIKNLNQNNQFTGMRIDTEQFV